MAAGTSSNRTKKASIRTPIARPKPIGLMVARCEKAKPPKTVTMIRAAATTTPLDK
ncbi:unannotated protein [freshwater metagenome]|uniref:Unannotated protein n=1 Tax=freshwater metagenome TaxID=449393 RepID=A0A6J6MEM8_9ZZZZ